MKRIFALAALAAAILASVPAPAGAACPDSNCHWSVQVPLNASPFWYAWGTLCADNTYCTCTPPNLIPTQDLANNNPGTYYITACYFNTPPTACDTYCRYQSVQFAYPGPTYVYAWVQIGDFCSSMYCDCSVPNMAPDRFYNADSGTRSQVDTYCHY